MKKIVLILFLLVIFNNYAQHSCGTKGVELSEWHHQLESIGLDLDSKPNLRSRASKYIPIHYHLVTKDDGSEAMPLHSLMEMHCRMNATFKRYGADFIFYIDQISYINSTSLFNMTLATESQLTKNNTLNHCNVYLVNNPNGQGGYTYLPHPNNSPANRSAIFVRGSREFYWYSEPRIITMEHEMGHWLGLPHTFFGWEGKTYGAASAIPDDQRERVVRTGGSSNCKTAGDGFCDTDPDYLSENWDCKETKTFKDPLGVDFNLKTNIMGYNYVPDNNTNCDVPFSQEQIARMHFSMESFNERKDLLNIPAPTGNKVDSITGLYPITNNNSLLRLNVNDITLSWNNNPNATQYIVSLAKGNSSLNTNFIFTGQNIIFEKVVTENSIALESSLFGTSFPNDDYYYWSVRGINKLSAGCESLNFFSSGQAFRVSNTNVSITTKKTTCFGDTDGKITIVDPDSFVVQTTVNGAIIAGKDTSNLADGSYIVETTLASAEIVQFNASTLTPKLTGHMGYSLVRNAEIKPEGGTPPYTYWWSNNQTGKSQMNMPIGDYKAVITDKNNCQSDTIRFKINENTGSINSNTNEKLFIYPTTIKYGESLNLSDDLMNGHTTIINRLGKTIRKFELHNTRNIKWDIQNAGLYFIHIKTDQIDKVFKIESRD